MEWQDIETAPKDGAWIIIFNPSYVFGNVRAARYTHDIGLGEDIWEYGWDGYEYPSGPEAPTLWQPLPTPPKPKP